jgi:hypothetical protein
VLRLKVDFLRALKNKVPAGRYAVMCTIYDRIGGTPLHWYTLILARCIKLSGAANPVFNAAVNCLTPKKEKHPAKKIIL